MITRLTLLSQASQRARAAEINVPSPVVAAPKGPRSSGLTSQRTRLPPTARKLAAGPCSRAIGGQRVVAQLHERVGQLLEAAAGVAGGPVRLHVGLQRDLGLLPAFGVEFEPAGHRPVGVLGDRQEPALGGVGFGAVGVQPRQVVVHHLGELMMRLGGRHCGEQPVDLGQVDARRRGGGQVLGPGDRRDRGDGVVGHRAGRERRG
jgi:hypothetical protein